MDGECAATRIKFSLSWTIDFEAQAGMYFESAIIEILDNLTNLPTREAEEKSVFYCLVKSKEDGTYDTFSKMTYYKSIGSNTIYFTSFSIITLEDYMQINDGGAV
jgi:hypothetical protein